MRTIHTAHGGKLSLARVLRGAFADGAVVVGSRGGEERIAGLVRLMGASSSKIARAEEGDTVAFQKLESVATGDRFVEAKGAPESAAKVAPPPPTQSVAIHVRDRKDEVRLAAALAKLTEEDTALAFVHDPEASELLLFGQGEMHLRVIVERLAARFGVAVDTKKPSVAYRETIREGVDGARASQEAIRRPWTVRRRGRRGRAARPGRGFRLRRESARRHGAEAIFLLGRDGRARRADARAVGLSRGRRRRHPARRLLSHRRFLRHGVSRGGENRARRGAAEGKPVLLEPVLAVSIYVPSDALARASALVSARRGQILGFEAREGWQGWETLRALIPEAEIGDLIVELRSATAGVGAFETKFDHLAELSGKPAEAVVAARKR